MGKKGSTEYLKGSTMQLKGSTFNLMLQNSIFFIVLNVKKNSSNEKGKNLD